MSTKLSDYNQTVAYILPLLDIEVKHFDGNFISAYCDPIKKQVHVKCKTNFPQLGEIINKPTYVNIYTNLKEPNVINIIYNIPEEFKEDFDHFLNSSVSKFSSDAKNKVKLSNDLVTKEGARLFCYHEVGSYEHNIVLALFNKLTGVGDVNPLWEYRSEQIGVDLPDDAELMEKIDPKKELINYEPEEQEQVEKNEPGLISKA